MKISIKVSLCEITLWGQGRSDRLSHEDRRTSSFHLWLFVAVQSFYFRPTSHIFVVQHFFDYGRDETAPCKPRSCQHQVSCSSVEQTLETLCLRATSTLQ
jgi:hypothetical protein